MLQGSAAQNKRLSNGGVLAGYKINLSNINTCFHKLKIQSFSMNIYCFFPFFCVVGKDGISHRELRAKRGEGVQIVYKSVYVINGRPLYNNSLVLTGMHRDIYIYIYIYIHIYIYIFIYIYINKIDGQPPCI